MKRALPTLTVFLGLLALTACSPEMGLYENALDKDREAREKMVAALGMMRDAQAMTEAASEGEKDSEAIKDKRQEAIKAFAIADKSWKEAEKHYRRLILDHPDDPVYLNNLANLLYFKARSGVVSEKGLGADLEGAERLLESALGLEEEKTFRRNLELITELRENAEVRREAEENRRIVEEFRSLVEAGTD